MTKFRLRSAIASWLTTVFVVNAFALEATPRSNASDVTGAPQAATAAPQKLDSPSVPAGTSEVSVVSAVGTSNEATVTLSTLPAANNMTSRRVHIEDAEISETVEIDVERDEIRAFGLTFHVTKDAAGGPVTLTLSANADSIDLTADSDPEAMAPRQRIAAERVRKFYGMANVAARAQRVQQVLQQTIAEGRHPHTAAREGRKEIRAQYDLSNCIWDILALIVDWASVVLACGPAIIVPVICVGTIAWATYETVMICRNMPNDCGGG